MEAVQVGFLRKTETDIVKKDTLIDVISTLIKLFWTEAVLFMD